MRAGHIADELQRCFSGLRIDAISVPIILMVTAKHLHRQFAVNFTVVMLNIPHQCPEALCAPQRGGFVAKACHRHVRSLVVFIKAVITVVVIRHDQVVADFAFVAGASDGIPITGGFHHRSTAQNGRGSSVSSLSNRLLFLCIRRLVIIERF